MPTQILHGDDDQIVPLTDSPVLSTEIMKNAKTAIYEDGSVEVCAGD